MCSQRRVPPGGFTNGKKRNLFASFWAIGTLKTSELKMVVRMFRELLSTTKKTCVYGAWMAHTRRSVDGGSPWLAGSGP